MNIDQLTARFLERELQTSKQADRLLTQVAKELPQAARRDFLKACLDGNVLHPELEAVLKSSARRLLKEQP